MPAWRRRWATSLAAGIVLGAVALFGAVRHRQNLSVAKAAPPQWADEVIEEQAANNAEKEESGTVGQICDNYPRLVFDKCTHNNLALKGPDKGDEGMVFHARNSWTGHEFELVVNAISSYKPFSPRMNGMSGEYGSINIQSGSSVKVKISVRHLTTKEPIKEPYFALCFFDLDQGLSGTSQESVTITNFTSFALSDDVHPGAGSEVRVISNPDNSKTFMSSTFGTGADNPKHPLKLNQQQKNRAVSVKFHNFRSADVTFAASPGIEPRFFTFVSYPALLCSADYKLNRLANLKYNPPLEVPIVAGRGDVFKQWYHHPGDKVAQGEQICSTERDGAVHIYRAPHDGEVVAIQAGLKEGDLIRQRVSDKTICILKTEGLSPLPVGPGAVQTAAPNGMIFKKYHVEENDIVVKGDPIADVADSNGQITTLTASKSGPITSIQSQLKPGDNTGKLSDGNCATIGRLPKLPVASDSSATNVPPGCTFVRYLVNVGDDVKVNTAVAEVEVDGKLQEVETVTAGTVAARQENLLKGMQIDEAMMDHNILVVGKGESQPKLAPLPVKAGQHPASVPPDMEFLDYKKEVGDVVNRGDPLLEVRNKNGEDQLLASTGSGMVMARQDRLESGEEIDEVMTDTNLMVVGKLPALEVDEGEAASSVPPGSYTFEEYKVNVGDTVQKGDTVAEVKDPNGNIIPVTASKYGKVKSRQEDLPKGADVAAVLEDSDLVVVGKFPAVEAGGLTEISVDAPPDAVFDKWYVKDGQRVEAGDKIAQVTVPGGEAQGAEGRRLQGFGGGTTQDILSPTWGTIKGQQPLTPGKKITAQQEGPSICKLDEGLPWWLGILCTLLVLCCCLCILFGVMKKPVPYQPMPPAEEPPEPEPIVEKPDGLRLDFEEPSGIVHTVYAKRRPLGIKHNFIAPIIANDFTINSYAKLELGVKERWKLRRIGDEELFDNPNFDEVNGKLHDYMRDFELWPLPIDFKMSHNSSQVTTVEFRERPIGIEFTNRAPIKVSKIYAGSPAEAADVQEGWLVTRIGEADVTQNANFREVIGFFNEGVQPLDEGGSPQTS